MKTFYLTSLVALACAAAAQAKPAVHEANIKMNGIEAKFTFTPTSDAGNGARVLVDVKKGLTKSFAVMPDVGFQYHIHVYKVGAGNNCTSTGGHLNPTPEKVTAACGKNNQGACEEGDLSGKHGNLPSSKSGKHKIEYKDAYLEFVRPTYSIANARSVVIHNNGTRVACANIVPVKPPKGAVKPPKAGVKPPKVGVKPPKTGVKPPKTGVKPPKVGVKPPKGAKPAPKAPKAPKPKAPISFNQFHW
ncbi:hypothetical protein B0O80DRAFT_443793 [Mortierella sp. GBAus27b]|nr:hypothetical protein BGX31_009498 [Mortierella sp. GBA43]KAI8358013.1 hypothetical protein B0O80DRAFT_443793 [Mortierella sp. GBAus27b]